MEHPTEPNFVHRTNGDGTFDSICLKCFMTVATVKYQVDLKNVECEHACDPQTVAGFRIERNN